MSLSKKRTFDTKIEISNIEIQQNTQNNFKVVDLNDDEIMYVISSIKSFFE